MSREEEAASVVDDGGVGEAVAQALAFLGEKPCIADAFKTLLSIMTVSTMDLGGDAASTLRETIALIRHTSKLVNDTSPYDACHRPQGEEEDGMDYIAFLANLKAAGHAYSLVCQKGLRPTKALGKRYFALVWRNFVREAIRQEHIGSGQLEEDGEAVEDKEALSSLLARAFVNHIDKSFAEETGEVPVHSESAPELSAKALPSSTPAVSETPPVRAPADERAQSPSPTQPSDDHHAKRVNDALSSSLSQAMTPMPSSPFLGIESAAIWCADVNALLQRNAAARRPATSLS